MDKLYGFRKYSSAQAQLYLGDRLINSIVKGILVGENACLFESLGNPDAKLCCSLHPENLFIFSVQRNAGVTSLYHRPAGRNLERARNPSCICLRLCGFISKAFCCPV